MLAILAVVALAEAAFALPLAVAIRHRQADEDRRELVQLAALSASRVEGDELPEAVLVGAEPGQRIGLYDRSARRIGGDGPEVLEPEAREALADRIVDARVGGDLVTAVPVLNEGRVVAVVRTSESAASSRARVYWTWFRLGALGLATLGLAGVVALALARRLTVPLARLGGDAARIGDGDFTVSARRTGLPEIDRVGDSLTGAARRISDLLAREQAFSADASHQLRSPLTGLRLTLEAELARPRADPTVALALALDDVERLEATIDELLALARDTGGPRAPVDLRATLDALADRWDGALGRRARHLRVSLPSGLASPTVSASALAHILDVLVDNAVGHGAGTVEVAAREVGGAVAIDVRDHGAGVADPAAAFSRRQGSAGGTGIGLSLARRLAEAEGGRLRLLGPLPSSTFELTLPVGPRAVPPAHLPPSGADGATS